MAKRLRRSKCLRKQWHTTLVFFTDGQWSAFVSRNRRDARNFAATENKGTDVDGTVTYPYSLTPQWAIDAHNQARDGSVPWPTI